MIIVVYSREFVTVSPDGWTCWQVRSSGPRSAVPLPKSSVACCDGSVTGALYRKGKKARNYKKAFNRIYHRLGRKERHRKYQTFIVKYSPRENKRKFSFTWNWHVRKAVDIFRFGLFCNRWDKRSPCSPLDCFGHPFCCSTRHPVAGSQYSGFSLERWELAQPEVCNWPNTLNTEAAEPTPVNTWLPSLTNLNNKSVCTRCENCVASRSVYNFYILYKLYN